MNLQPITDVNEVRVAFASLKRNLTRQCRSMTRFLGWQGGHGRYRIHFNPRLQFWTLVSEKYGKKRNWLFLGTGDPTPRKQVGIICEVNIQKKGYSRRCAGAIALDDRGQVYLTHSGKIGGGRKGIGKRAFVAAYRGDNWAIIRWPDRKETEVIVIGRIDDKNLPRQLAHFAREVKRFKKTAIGIESNKQNQSKTNGFTPEFSGKRKSYKISGTIDNQADHGTVISALAATLEKKYKLKTANDRSRDLFVLGRTGLVRVLFEAKTDLSTSSFYQAVGQLLLNSAVGPQEPKRVLVIPGKPTGGTSKALDILRIRVLSYAWSRDTPKFKNLGEVLT